MSRLARNEYDTTSLCKRNGHIKQVAIA